MSHTEQAKLLTDIHKVEGQIADLDETLANGGLTHPQAVMRNRKRSALVRQADELRALLPQAAATGEVNTPSTPAQRAEARNGGGGEVEARGSEAGQIRAAYQAGQISRDEAIARLNALKSGGAVTAAMPKTSPTQETESQAPDLVPSRTETPETLEQHAEKNAGYFQRPRAKTAFGAPAIVGREPFDAASAAKWAAGEIVRLANIEQLTDRDRQRLRTLRNLIEPLFE